MSLDACRTANLKKHEVVVVLPKAQCRRACNNFQRCTGLRYGEVKGIHKCTLLMHKKSKKLPKKGAKKQKVSFCWSKKAKSKGQQFKVIAKKHACKGKGRRVKGKGIKKVNQMSCMAYCIADKKCKAITSEPGKCTIHTGAAKKGKATKGAVCFRVVKEGKGKSKGKDKGKGKAVKCPPAPACPAAPTCPAAPACPACPACPDADTQFASMEILAPYERTAGMVLDVEATTFADPAMACRALGDAKTVKGSAVDVASKCATQCGQHVLCSAFVSTATTCQHYAGVCQTMKEGAGSATYVRRPDKPPKYRHMYGTDCGNSSPSDSTMREVPVGAEGVQECATQCTADKKCTAYALETDEAAVKRNAKTSTRRCWPKVAECKLEKDATVDTFSKIGGLPGKETPWKAPVRNPTPWVDGILMFDTLEQKNGLTCGGQHLMSSMQFGISKDNKRARWNPKCDFFRGPAGSVEDESTKQKIAIPDIAYLDKHNVQCKNNRPLLSAEPELKADKLRFKMTCAKDFEPADEKECKIIRSRRISRVGANVTNMKSYAEMGEVKCPTGMVISGYKHIPSRNHTRVNVNCCPTKPATA